MCKPHKRGGANRWKPKDEMLLKEAEKFAREGNEIMYDQFMYDAVDDFDFCEQVCCKETNNG